MARKGKKRLLQKLGKRNSERKNIRYKKKGKPKKYISKPSRGRKK